MSKESSVLSRKYFRVRKWTYSSCAVVTGILAFAFAFLPFFVKLPPGSHSLTLGGMGLMITLSILFGMRVDSLQENEAIYRAITRQAGENTGGSRGTVETDKVFRE